MGRVGHGPPKILVGSAPTHLATPIIGLICSLIRLKICQILRLEGTKFAFRRGSAPTPLGSLPQSPPDPVFKGTTSKGKEEKGGDGKGEEERQIRGKEQGGGRDLPHPKILA